MISFHSNKDDNKSLTAATESVPFTAVTEAKGERDAATIDTPNAFIQTKINQGPGEERTMMKTQGTSVDALTDINPLSCKDAVAFENGKKTSCMQALRAIHRMLQSAMLFHKKFRKDLECIGFEHNPHDPCVANNKVAGNQMTIAIHVDNIKASHKSDKEMTKFVKCLQDKCGEIGKLKATRGKKHTHSGIKLDCSVRGKVKVDM